MGEISLLGKTGIGMQYNLHLVLNGHNQLLNVGDTQQCTWVIPMEVKQECRALLMVVYEGMKLYLAVVLIPIRL